MENARVFIAVNLPDAVKRELGLLQRKLRSGKEPYVKWVPPDNIHLTLRFLGNTRLDLLTNINTAMTKVAEKTIPFKLKVAGLGVFPNPGHVQVVWTALEGDTEVLVDLQKRLDKELGKLGFVVEKRPFKPHLTLARVRGAVTPAQRGLVAESVKKLNYEGKSSFKVTSINLMSSLLTPQGATYKQLATAYLGGMVQL